MVGGGAVLGLLCGVIFEGISALAWSDLAEKPGYHIEYCDNSKEWTDWGHRIKNFVSGIACSNQEEDTVGRECVHYLVGEVMNNFIYTDASDKYNVMSHSSVSWGAAPTSILDERFTTAYNSYGYWAFPCDAGMACITTDNQLWVIRPEYQYTNAWGTIYGSTYDVDQTQSLYSDTIFAHHGRDTRLYWIKGSTNCENGINGKFVKDLCHYVWSSDAPGGGGYDLFTPSHEFSGNLVYGVRKDLGAYSGRYVYNVGFDKLANGFSVVTSSGVTITARELVGDFSNYDYYSGSVFTPDLGSAVCPSTAMALYNMSSRGLSLSLDGSVSYDASGNLVYYDNAVSGFPLAGCTHLVHKYRCHGHYVANSYNIVYNANGGTGSVPDGHTGVVYDEEVYINSNQGLSREGYEFCGWSLSSGTGYSDTTNIILGGSKVKNLTTENGATVTLYAVWRPIGYTVNVNPNVPENTSSQITYIK